jgi:hypothetical protein
MISRTCKSSLLGLLAACMALPAYAKSGGIKFAPDYSDLRGFNYNPASVKVGAMCMA